MIHQIIRLWAYVPADGCVSMDAVVQTGARLEDIADRHEHAVAQRNPALGKNANDCRLVLKSMNYEPQALAAMGATEAGESSHTPIATWGNWQDPLVVTGSGASGSDGPGMAVIDRGSNTGSAVQRELNAPGGAYEAHRWVQSLTEPTSTGGMISETPTPRGARRPGVDTYAENMSNARSRGHAEQVVVRNAMEAEESTAPTMWSQAPTSERTAASSGTGRSSLAPGPNPRSPPPDGTPGPRYQDSQTTVAAPLEARAVAGAAYRHASGAPRATRQSHSMRDVWPWQPAGPDPHHGLLQTGGLRPQRQAARRVVAGEVPELLRGSCEQGHPVP